MMVCGGPAPPGPPGRPQPALGCWGLSKSAARAREKVPAMVAFFSHPSQQQRGAKASGIWSPGKMSYRKEPCAQEETHALGCPVQQPESGRPCCESPFSAINLPTLTTDDIAPKKILCLN